MNTEKLIQFIDRPEELDETSLPEIEQWLEAYPFFQTAHLLRVKNLQNLETGIDKHTLNLTAAYVTDRKVLYYLLHKFHELPDEDQEYEEEPRIHDKEIKDTLQENISDTITRQKDIYSLESGHEIELIPGLAIDIRKEYGEGIPMEDVDISFAQNRNFRQSELLEIADEGPVDEEWDDGQYTPIEEPDGFSFELDQDTDLIEVVEPEETVTEEPQNEKEVYASEEELDEARSRSFTDWLDHVNTADQNSTEEFISGEAPEEPRLLMEHPYDLKKLAASEPENPAPNDKASSHFSLIDKFIEENPRIIPRDKTPGNVDMSAESIKEHESFFTDTLARIYIKQGNYAKAIFAYEKLSLKYPEKSTYFAGQISQIKKLIQKS